MYQITLNVRPLEKRGPWEGAFSLPLQGFHPLFHIAQLKPCVLFSIFSRAFSFSLIKEVKHFQNVILSRGLFAPSLTGVKKNVFGF